MVKELFDLNSVLELLTLFFTAAYILRITFFERPQLRTAAADAARGTGIESAAQPLFSPTGCSPTGSPIVPLPLVGWDLLPFVSFKDFKASRIGRSINLSNQGLFSADSVVRCLLPVTLCSHFEVGSMISVSRKSLLRRRPQISSRQYLTTKIA